MAETKNILLVGVGGQGIILTSRVLTAGLMRAGFDVKMSEVHGMAQRGGSVSTQVRYGERVFSPLFGDGEADVLVAFEKAEALRYANGLKKDGLCIVNDYKIVPMSVSAGGAIYPENAIEAMAEKFRVLKINAASIAEEAGSPRSANIAILGALVAALGLEGLAGAEGKGWEAVLAEILPGKVLDVNIAAYKAGLKAAKSECERIGI